MLAEAPSMVAESRNQLPCSDVVIVAPLLLAVVSVGCGAAAVPPWGVTTHCGSNAEGVAAAMPWRHWAGTSVPRIATLLSHEVKVGAGRVAPAKRAKSPVA